MTEKWHLNQQAQLRLVDLAKMVQQRTSALAATNFDLAKANGQLQAEREKSERLLLNIFPKPIVERMKKGETHIADSHADATVLVADLVGLSSLSTHIDPGQIVMLLNEVFSAFDVLVEKHGLENIKTIGDAYMVAGGISVPRQDHAEAIAELAIDLREEVERLNQQYDTSFRIRIGICTGPVIAGVIGQKKIAYDLWGETVNIAWHLESTGQAGRVQIAESTYERLKDKYHFEKQDSLDTNGSGGLPAYWLGNRIGDLAMIGATGKVEGTRFMRRNSGMKAGIKSLSTTV